MGVDAKNWKESLHSLSKRCQNGERLQSTSVSFYLVQHSLNQSDYHYWHQVHEILNAIEDKDAFFQTSVDNFKVKAIPSLIKNLKVSCSVRKWSGVEDILDIIHLIVDSLPKVTESLTESVGSLLTISTTEEVGFSGQLEAIKLVNLILEALNKTKTERVKQTEEYVAFRDSFPNHLNKAGDYEFQASIVETVFRFIPTEERFELWNKWFASKELQHTCKLIKNEQFETGCRIFLNIFNESRNQSRRVYSYPCVSASLGKQQLAKPNDDHIPEFWVDFNFKSRSISFFVDDSKSENGGGSWEIVVIKTEDVQDFRFHDNGRDNVFILKLIEPAYLLLPSCHESPEKYAKILFSRIYPIQSIVERLFGKENYDQKKSQFKTNGVKPKTSVSAMPLHLNSFVKPKPVMKPCLYSGGSSSEDQLKSSPARIKLLPTIPEDRVPNHNQWQPKPRKIPQPYSSDNETFIEPQSSKVDKIDLTVLYQPPHTHAKPTHQVNDASSPVITIPETQVYDDNTIDMVANHKNQQTVEYGNDLPPTEIGCSPTSLSRSVKNTIKSKKKNAPNDLKLTKSITDLESIPADSPFAFPVTPKTSEPLKGTKLHMLNPARKQVKKPRAPKKKNCAPKKTKARKSTKSSDKSQISSNYADKPKKRVSTRQSCSQDQTMSTESVKELFTPGNIVCPKATKKSKNKAHKKVASSLEKNKTCEYIDIDEPEKSVTLSKRSKKTTSKHVDLVSLTPCPASIPKKKKSGYEHIDIEIDTNLYEVIETKNGEQFEEETPYKPHDEFMANNGLKQLQPRSLIDDLPLIGKCNNKFQPEVDFVSKDLDQVKTPAITPYQSTIDCASVSSNVAGKLYYEEDLDAISDCGLDANFDYNAFSEVSVTTSKKMNVSSSTSVVSPIERTKTPSTDSAHSITSVDCDPEFRSRCDTRTDVSVMKHQTTTAVSYQSEMKVNKSKTKPCQAQKVFNEECIDTKFTSYDIDNDYNAKHNQNQGNLRTFSAPRVNKATSEIGTFSARNLQTNEHDEDAIEFYCSNENYSPQRKKTRTTRQTNTLTKRMQSHGDELHTQTRLSSAADLIGYKSPLPKCKEMAESSDEVEEISDESEEALTFTSNHAFQSKKSKQSTKKKIISKSMDEKTTNSRKVSHYPMPMSDMSLPINSFADICKGIISESRNRSVCYTPKTCTYTDSRHESRDKDTRNYGSTTGLESSYQTPRYPSILATPPTKHRKRRRDSSTYHSKQDRRQNHDVLDTPLAANDYHDETISCGTPNHLHGIWNSPADYRGQRKQRMTSYIEDLLQEFDQQEFLMRLGSLEQDVSTFTKKFAREASSLRNDYRCSMLHVTEIIDALKIECENSK